MCRTCSSGRPTARSSALAITRSWLRCRATPWRAAATRTPAASDSERSRAIHSPGAVVVQWGAMRIIAPISSLTVLAATVALADPYGPPYAVTDMAPFCATCHASTSPAQLLDLPAEAAAAETTEGKHFGRIRTDPVYRDLSPADRERLIAAIKWVDEQASVTIQVPSQARRSSRIEVTVVTRGGAGPVVGVSLVDSAIRYQARPISASGFKAVGPALVVGPKAQAQWAERRLRGSDMGLNTVMITGIDGDPVTKRVDETRTTWVLRTPPEPGTYSVAAAFFYGTEKGRPLGTVVRNGRAEPRGGPGGASGRIMFSDVVKINVK